MPQSETLGDMLKRRLARRVSPSQYSMSPALAYGRHRGPIPRASRQAAVAVAIYRASSGQWTIPLTLRPETLQHHGGQVCLPGGRIEPGENARQAALREFEEELGTRAAKIEDCGQLSTQYVYASDNAVHPVVFLMDQLQQPLVPDPMEVAEVIELPLSALQDPSRRLEFFRTKTVQQGPAVVGQMRFRAQAIRHGNHDIWGATAMILEDLARILQPTG